MKDIVWHAEAKVTVSGIEYDVFGGIKFVQQPGAREGSWGWNDFGPTITPKIDEDDDETFNEVTHRALADYLKRHPELMED